MKRKGIIVFVLAILMLFTAACSAKSEKEYNVFCWENLNPDDSKISCKYTANPITISGNSFTIEGSGDYLLCGDPSWTSEEMNAIAAEAKSKCFKGIVYDVEKWDDQEALATAYEELTTNLDVHVCLPFWFDIDQAERIVKSVDCIELMVYYKGEEKELANPILQLAEKYDKKVNIVYELQAQNEQWDVKDYNTYNGDIDAVLENYKVNFANRAGLSLHGLY